MGGHHFYTRKPEPRRRLSGFLFPRSLSFILSIARILLFLIFLTNGVLPAPGKYRYPARMPDITGHGAEFFRARVAAYQAAAPPAPFSLDTVRSLLSCS